MPLPARARTCLLVLLAAAASGACEEAGPAEPAIPDHHPCPQWGLTPEVPSLWSEATETGEPVPLALALPFPAELEVEVSQGAQQAPTHEGTLAWALDFAVPVDTPVLAAAPGVVVLVRDDSDRHGSTSEFLLDANWIVLDHGGGLFTSYVHLARDSALVGPGEVVAAGAPLARTGLSGQLAGPHLHFQAENVWSDSLPVRFASTSGCDVSPETGDVLVSTPDVVETLVGRGEASLFPGETFADMGVTWIEGGPARVLPTGSTIALAGDAAPGVVDVYALVFPEAGGDSLTFARYEVDGTGRFTGALDLAGLPAGRYGWAVVGVGIGEEPAAARSVRLSLH